MRQLNFGQNQDARSRGRPPKGENYYNKSSNCWTGNFQCAQIMNILASECTFLYRYITGVGSKQNEENQNKEKISNLHKKAKQTVLEMLGLDISLKYLLIRQESKSLITLDNNKKILSEEIIDFTSPIDNEEFLPLIKIMSKIKRLLDKDAQICFQKILDMYIFGKSQLTEEEFRNESIFKEHTANQLTSEILNYMQNDRSTFISFFHLQIIRNYIDNAIQNNNEMNSLNGTSNHKQQKREKQLEKVLQMSLILEQDNTILRSFLLQIFSVWDSCFYPLENRK